MAIINNQAAVLLLEDGTVFHGNAIGKIGTTSGEICFNTGMTGYQEIFTDPSYYAQIMADRDTTIQGVVTLTITDGVTLTRYYVVGWVLFLILGLIFYNKMKQYL